MGVDGVERNVSQGGLGVFLKGFEFPLRTEEDPLLIRRKIKSRERNHETRRKDSHGKLNKGSP